MKQIQGAECNVAFGILLSVFRSFSIFVNIKNVQNEKSATKKKWNMKKGQREKSTT